MKSLIRVLSPYVAITNGLHMHKGPRTLQLKLQKSSYCPYTLQLFFTTATIFQQFYIWTTIFTKIFSEKSL